MIISNLKNIPKQITLSDGKSIHLNPHQKAFPLEDKYYNDEVLKRYEQSKKIKISKEKVSVEDKNTRKSQDNKKHGEDK